MRLAALVLALAACTETTTETDQDTKALLAFRADLAQLDRIGSEYVPRMVRANASTCVGVRNTYVREVDPILRFQMPELAGQLDQMISDRGGGSFGDLRCVVEALRAALDAHDAAECSGDNAGAEALSHFGTVAFLVDHARARTDELLAGSAFAVPPIACP
jgi:hypothetical protein